MDTDRAQVIATLAASIVVARSAKTVAEVQQAWTDAENIIHPRPADQRYKDWQTASGLIATTPEQDAAKKAASAERAANVRRQIAGRMAR